MNTTTPLRNLPLAVVDCEATDLPGPGRIVEVAVVHLTLAPDAVPVVAYTSRVRPVDAEGRQIPSTSGALKAHGIADADLASAPTWAEVFPAVEEACRGRVLCAYNVPADWGFMVASGASPAPWDAWVDLHVIARAINKFSHSLSEVAREHGIALDAHGATGDAVTTALVARPLLTEWWHQWAEDAPRGYSGNPDDGDDGYDPRMVTLGDLLTWQHKAAVEQEADFVGWLRSKGARGSKPDSPWTALLGLPEPFWPAPPAPSYRVERDGRVLPVVEGVKP